MNALSALLAALLAADAPAPDVPRLQLPDGVRPLRYALDLVARADRDRFEGSVAIEVELAREERVVWLHARDLRIRSARADAGDVRAEATLEQVTPDGVARLVLARPLGPGRATLRVEFDGAWGGLVGLHRMEDAGARYVATQFEAIEARRAFPCFDEPRFKTPFDVRLTVRAGDVAIGNAPVAAEEPAGDGARRVRFATTEPLPTYLLFVAAGPFDVVEPPPLPPNELRARPLPVRLLAPRGEGAKLAWAAEATRAVVPWFERWFGIAFPYAKLDQLAVPAHAFGGMENAGAVTYAAPVFLVDATTPPARRLAVAVAVAHELSHQWFGNLVTPPWWTDLWLNESFATWASHAAVDAWRPELHATRGSVARTDAVMRDDARASARAVRQPLVDVSRIDDQFDDMSYTKGAAALRMVERFAGPERFRAALSRYLREHAHGTGSAGDLFAALSREAGRDLAGPLRTFLDQPGVPLVRARVDCGREGATLRLAQERYRQRGSEAPAASWQVPVCARFAASGGGGQRCVLLDGPTASVALGPRCPDWVLPNAGAAGYYRWTLRPEGLARLVRAAARLEPEERAMLPGAIVAAQQAGDLPAGDALAALATLARGADPVAAVEAVRALEVLDRALFSARDRAFEAWARAAIGPALRRVGTAPRTGEATDASRLRAALVTFLAVVARDPAVLEQGSRFADDFLADPDGAAARRTPELAGALLAAAVEARPALAETLARRLEGARGTRRSLLLFALTRHDAAAAREPLRALWGGAALSPADRTEMEFGFDDPPRPASLDALATALERDFDGVVARTPPHGVAYLPFRAGHPCAEGQEARLRGLFAARLEAHPELRLPYAQAVEDARLCAAWREADGRAAAGWLARRAAR